MNDGNTREAKKNKNGKCIKKHRVKKILGIAYKTINREQKYLVKESKNRV